MSTADADGGHRYVWLHHARVLLDGLRLMCEVAVRILPLPVLILHAECTLAHDGDKGRRGVPRRWAKERGLLEEAPWRRC